MHDERLEQLLRAERQVRPDPGAEDRIWAALEHRLTHGPPPPGGADVMPGAAGGATGTALKIAAGLALIAGAVGVLVAGVGADPPAPRELPPVATVHVPEDRSIVEPPAALAEPFAVVAPALAPVEPAEPAAEPPVEAPKRPSRTRAKPVVSDPPARSEPGPEDFAAELQLIAAIRGALKRGDSAAALAGVDEHARRFGARGQLVQERMAYQVEALCGADRVADARRVAGDLLARWPDSTHAPRVKQSCAGI